MKGTNTILVSFTIPSEEVLKKVTRTPALARLTRLKLQVGVNRERVNHKQYADMARMFPILGIPVAKLNTL